jgi:plastocyanin
MEERETQARRRAGGVAFGRARWRLLAGASTALVAVAVIPAPGSQIAASARLADETITALPSNVFDRPTVTVNQGDTVTWRNGGGAHNVIFEDGVRHPDTGTSPDPWEFPRTFNAAGTYRYYCSAHGALGSGMSGTVTVNAVAPPPGGPPPPGPPPPGGGTTPPGSPPPGAPGAGKSATTVTLQVSDSTPARGARVRFFGSVRPEQDGRLVQLQRRARGGSYRTVARIKLSDAGASRSKFSKRLRVLGDGVFRARLPTDSAHAAGTSRTRRVDVR